MAFWLPGLKACNWSLFPHFVYPIGTASLSHDVLLNALHCSGEMAPVTASLTFDADMF